MTADNLLQRLKVKHAQDVLVAECKDGPTHSRSHRRLDAWVLLKTWAPPTCIGYEIKVSRGDWLSDKKWESYRELANLFYLVAPKGLVRVEELPEGVGLMEAVGKDSSAGLRTVRKAVRRDGFPPPELLYYVLMNRFDASRKHADLSPVELRAMRIEQARKALENTKCGDGLDYVVKGRIREKLRDQESEIKRLQSVERVLVELGLSTSSNWWETEQQLRKAIGLDVERVLSDLERDITRIKERVTQSRQIRLSDTPQKDRASV